MKKRGHGKPEEIMIPVGNTAGRRLLHYINRYGEENIKNAIIEIRESVPPGFRRHETHLCSIAEEEALERMYRDYVSASRDPILTFIEYKALIDIMAELM